MTVFVFDDQLRYVLVGGAAFSQLGWAREAVLGHTPSDLMPAEQAAVLEEHFKAALRGETRQHGYPGVRRGDIFWSSTISPLLDANGSIVGGAVVSRDVAHLRRLEAARNHLEVSRSALSERVEAEQWQRERLEFLNEVNHVLTASVDRRDVMRAVTRAAVPRLGDWCSIHVFFEQTGGVPEVEIAHVNPAMVEYARDLMERFPYDPDAPTGVPLVVRTGESVLVSEITDELLAEMDVPEDALAVVRELQLRSVVTVPLTKRGRVLGAMQFVLSGSDRRYDRDDVTLAEAMAGRVASSLDNHRLMEQQKEIAHTLQQSLLPQRLPVVRGLEVGVAYWAAGEGAEVGGDFYDLFEIEQDRFGVVIGDVCGNGPRAAALTSLARQNVRLCAWRGDGPPEVLDHLNDAIRRNEAATFVTLVYCEMIPDADGFSLRLANAGHPPPIVVTSGGSARMVMPTGPLVAGLDATFGEVALRLEAGDTVVFYTDGATDLRPPGGLAYEELRSLVTRFAGTARHAQELVMLLSEELERRTPFAERQDDVALLVLRAGDGEAEERARQSTSNVPPMRQ